MGRLKRISNFKIEDYMMLEDVQDEHRFKIGKEVAEQIWREQQLTSSRMTWNLTFQSFMLTSFVITFGQSVDVMFALILRILIAAAGFFVALVAIYSVRASQAQRDHLKKIWSDLYPSPDIYAYPRPFAEYKHSQLGRRAPAKILVVLMILWGCLLILAIAYHLHVGRPTFWILNSYSPSK